MNCYDLDQQKRWRVFMSEDHEPGHHRDPWNKELHGRLGRTATIYPHGGDQMCAYVDYTGRRKALEAMGTVIQDGDTEVVVLFPVSRLDEVATLLRCYVKKGPPANAFKPGIAPPTSR
jgi:hypothetical protein